MEISLPLEDNDVTILWILLSRLGPSEGNMGKRMVFSGYLESHPAPSWRGVAWALYTILGGKVSAHDTIREIHKKGFLRGWLQWFVCFYALFLCI